MLEASELESTLTHTHRSEADGRVATYTREAKYKS